MAEFMATGTTDGKWFIVPSQYNRRFKTKLAEFCK